MEHDERRRQVRHRPPPGYTEPDFENRPRRIDWKRMIGITVALAMLAPILIGTIAIVAEALGD